MFSLLMRASRSNSGSSSTPCTDVVLRYHVSVSNSNLAIDGSYFVVVVRVSDGTRWSASRVLDEFVALDTSLRRQALWADDARGRLLPRFPSGQFLGVFRRPRGQVLEGGMAAQLQQYLEELVRHNRIERCVSLQRFLQARNSTGSRSRASSGASTTSVGSGIVDLDLSSLHVRVQQQGNGEACVICLADLETYEDVRALACGHTYHFHCIARWLSVQSGCCVCKRPVVPDVPPDEPRAA